MTDAIPRLLFVLGDKAAASSLGASLLKTPVAVETRYVETADAALDELATRAIDYVFADVHLEGSDGVDLFRVVEARFPDVVRVLVADPREIGSLTSSGIAHRCLAKPWDLTAITEVLRRRYELEAWLAEPGLQQALQRTERLPSAPSAYTAIAAEMRSADPSLAKIAAIIAQDPALTAKVLQHVNSAFFAFRQEITTIDRAVSMIGMNPIMALVMSVGLYGKPSPAAAAAAESIRGRSLAVAAFTRQIARIEGVTAADRDTAFLAAMLHDCGKLVMATSWPGEYSAYLDGDDLAAESSAFGADHALIGAYLLSTWNLADPVVEAVAHHHRPSAGNFSELGAAALVHIAHALVQRPGNGTLPDIDLELMGQFDLWDHTATWIAAAEDLEYKAANR